MRELPLAEWTGLIATVAFFVSVAVFAAVVYGAVRMSKKRAEREARLPLAEEFPKQEP